MFFCADKFTKFPLEYVFTHARPGGSVVVQVAGGATQPDPALAAARFGRYEEELPVALL